MTYAIFPTTSLGYLLAAKLHAAGASVVVGEEQPSDRFETLERYPAAKLRDALSKVKKNEYFLIFDKPQENTPEGFAGVFVPTEGDSVPGLVHFVRNGKIAYSALILENNTLGASNTGPMARCAQTLAATVKLPEGLEPTSSLALTTILGGGFPSLFAFVTLVGLTDLFETKDAAVASFGALVGVYDAPDYLSEPRDMLMGAGQTITEAVDDAYTERPEGLYRPREDFLGCYDGCLVGRFNEVAERYGLEPFDQEDERTRELAKQQEACRAEREALDAERKQMRESFETELARVKAEKEAEIAAVRQELHDILHEAQS